MKQEIVNEGRAVDPSGDPARPAPPPRRRGLARDAAEFALVWIVLKLLGALPLDVARRAGECIGGTVHRLSKKLDRVGMRNLELALPGRTPREHAAILRQALRNLGRQLGEFSQFPKLHPGNIGNLVEYQGLEHYMQAREAGRGVLILTGHIGSWELSSYAHSLFGFPMSFLVRPLDNRRLEALIDNYRCRGGNRSISKKDSARRVVAALRAGESVGILMDLNTQEHEGVFCNFFGIPACTSPIIAKLAARFDAPVIPGFLVWNPSTRKHLLIFGAALPLIKTGDPEADALANTERFNHVLADQIQRHPEQWFWVHKRWHTRPPGGASLYLES